MSQQPIAQTQWWRKPVRTGIQLVMGGALTFLATYGIQHWGPNLNAQDIAGIYGVVTFLTSTAQNYGEAHGLLPILLPTNHPAVVLPKQ